MNPSDSNIDWTGVQPDHGAIEPLNEHSFIVRLRILSERAQSLMVLRNALKQQQSHGNELPGDSEQ